MEAQKFDIEDLINIFFFFFYFVQKTVKRQLAEVIVTSTKEVISPPYVCLSVSLTVNIIL